MCLYVLYEKKCAEVKHGPNGSKFLKRKKEGKKERKKERN